MQERKKGKRTIDQDETPGAQKAQTALSAAL
jgi:hypothetical protein